MCLPWITSSHHPTFLGCQCWNTRSSINAFMAPWIRRCLARALWTSSMYRLVWWWQKTRIPRTMCHSTTDDNNNSATNNNNTTTNNHNDNNNNGLNSTSNNTRKDMWRQMLWCILCMHGWLRNRRYCLSVRMRKNSFQLFNQLWSINFSHNAPFQNHKSLKMEHNQYLFPSFLLSSSAWEIIELNNWD